MKMNKKGFTLVELLAVIVILAIIALIATPIILNVIDTAKKNASKSSAYGYLDAVEKSVMMDMVETQSDVKLSGTYTVQTDGSLKPNGTNAASVTIDVKGKAPKENGTITYTAGKLSACQLEVDGYTWYCKGNELVDTNPNPAS